MSQTESRKTGRVKFFNSTKGYGFIIPDDQAGQNEVEVFVHHTAIHNNGGFKSLAEGEEVEYDLVQGNKGMQAANVTGIGGGPVKGDPRAGQRQQYQNGGGGGYGGGRNQYNTGYPIDPYPSGGYGYPVGGGFPGYGGNAGGGGGNQAPPQGFQYGQPLAAMYGGGGGGQQQFGYQQPQFGMHSQQQQQRGYGSPQPPSPDRYQGH
ncbi:cold-shock' DNA-binding domain-domain-containing protein [Absidia repens]|uniref:Cold-shock' DNA-binding domain-domain-containing protein n=1 Tax=Absidia repens TaxID=90262 RepID=A0A1X2IYZ4_9FUNG|nr:cold-shock' DNA-binding domain-domain-containing protein [Absidia repens]